MLTFETSDGRTPIPPPTTHLLGTSSYPAPTNFLPLHYARIFLNSAEGSSRKRDKRVVIWIGCDGSNENHHRSALRRNGVNVSKQSFIYIDAMEEILEQPTASAASQSAALDRLHTRVEEQLSVATRYTQISEESEEIASGSELGMARCLVVVDDASALAWSISALDDERELDDESGRVDPRVQLLRSKKKGAIQRDSVGLLLGTWIEERLRKTCGVNMAILLTHLTAESSSIIAPAPHIQPSRGGSYGVGTGFDADDAGEENEDELYEEVADFFTEESKESDDKIDANGEVTATNAGVDWRVDSLIRRLLLDADLWIEIRGLRSGKARDCHGETLLGPSKGPAAATDAIRSASKASFTRSGLSTFSQS
ncbi:hypothetical protein CBS101457_003373 [Exobasidium rhododendri]|nr:hypothetical protein CBS101457_003373 [Exobasidium rhododendri]